MLGRRILGFLMMIAALAMGQSEAPPETEEDQNEWVIETYSFPDGSHLRVWPNRREDPFGDLDDEDNASPEAAPSLPDENASEAEFTKFLKRSNQQALRFFESNNYKFPKGALLAFDPQSLTLAARLPRRDQGYVFQLAHQYRADVQKYISVNLYQFEAPTELIREIVREAGKQADHASLLEQLQMSEARSLAVYRTEARSGQRAKIEQVQEIYLPTGHKLDQRGRLTYRHDIYPIGTVIEVDPVIGADGKTIDLNINPSYDYAPPEMRKARYGGTDENPQTVPLMDRYLAQVTSAYTLQSGGAKLLNVWHPKDSRDRMQAMFLTADVAQLAPEIDTRVTEILRKHGESVVPTPPPTPPVEEKAKTDEGDELFTQTFRVPPSFITSGGGGGGGPSDDPFADLGTPPATNGKRKTAQEILEDVGVSFPSGASAIYNPTTSQLIVRNTAPNIELVDAYTSSGCCGCGDTTVGVSAHIIQAPSAVLRRIAQETRKLGNHERAWQALQKNPDAKILETIWVEARSGQRAKVTAGKEHMLLGGIAHGPALPVEPDNKDKSVALPKPNPDLLCPVTTVEFIGTSLEIHPVIGADGFTIDLNLNPSYDYAPPVFDDRTGAAPTFRRARVSTAMTIHSGNIRMIGLWKPEGTPEFDENDVQQALFIRASILRLNRDHEHR